MLNFSNKLTKNKGFAPPLFKKEGGFTLLETIITIFVISVGVLAAYAAVQQIFSYTFFAKSKLTAAYLAKEGIEIIRNIRDSNWVMGGTPWDNGLASTDWQNCDLPKYQRRITIIPVGVNKLKVLVEIRWQERGSTKILSAQENLWNWYGP